MSYGVFFNREPKEEYFIDMVIWNNLWICEQMLDYKSFYMRMWIWYKKEEIVWAYKLKNIIMDSQWENLHKNLLEVQVDWYKKDFSWNDIILNNVSLGENRGTLKI